MSLLDRAPHTLIVQPMVLESDSYGGSKAVADGDPVVVRGSVQPVSSEESGALGVQVDTSYRFIGRTWPGGAHSTATWDGRTFDQQGEARRYSMSPRTAHVDVLLKARGAA